MVSGQSDRAPRLTPRGMERTWLADALVRLAQATQRRPLWWRLAAGVLIVLAAVLLRSLVFGIWEPSAPYLTFYPAVSLAAFIGGIAGGVLAVLLSAFITHSMFATLDMSAGASGLLLFTLGGLLISALLTAPERIASTLSESEEQLRLALQAGGGGAWYWGASSPSVSVTASYRDLYGFDPDCAVTREAWLARLHPDDRERLAGQVAELLAKGGEYDQEFRIIHPDRGERWLRGRGRLELDASGKPAQFLGIDFDITERRQAEAAVRASEERLRLAAKAANFGIFEADLLSGESYNSPELNAIVGQPIGLVLPLNGRVPEYVHEGDREQLRTIVERALDPEGDGVIWAEYRIVRPNNTVRWVRVDGKVEFGNAATGRIPIHRRGTLVDITERKSAELELRESEARLAALVGSAMDAIISTDESQRIVLFNPAAEKMFGIAEAAAIGRPMSLLVPERHRDRHQHNFGLFAGTASIIRRMGELREITGLRSDGREFPIEASISQSTIAGRRIFTAVIRDISERKRVEASLQYSEMQLRLFIEQTPAAIAMFDRDMRYLAASRRWVGYFCPGEEDLVGVAHYELFPEIGENWKEVHRRGLAGEVLSAEEDPFPRADGRTQYTRWEVRPWHDAEGAIGGITIFAEDVTQRVEAEQAVRRQHEDLARAQAVAQTGSWRLDLKRNELTWSAENHRIFGVPEGTALTYETFLGIVHPDDRAEVDRKWRENLVGRVYDVEHRIVVDGRTKWVRERATLEIDEHGAVACGFGTTQDISDKKQAEQALAEREEQLRLSTEAGEIGTLSVDLPSGALNISAKTAAMLSFAGDHAYTLNDLMARVHEADAPIVLRALEAAGDPAGTGQLRSEFRVIRGDGAVRWLTWNGHMDFSRASGARVPFRMLGVCVDTTERRQMVEALSRTNVELEQRVAERTAALALEMEGREEAQKRLAQAQQVYATGRIASGLAHDFNNTLAAISAHLQFAEPRISDVKASESIKAALDAVELGASLNRRLLSVAGDTRRGLETVSVAELLQTIVALMSRSLGSCFELTMTVEPGLWPTRLDPRGFESAILNLLINAQDAMPGGGKISIEARNVTLAAAELPPGCPALPGDHVRVEVSDTGCGMTPEVKARAGEPFFTTKGTARGTGLGLSRVGELVRISGGFMRIESTVGVGTTVLLHFPRADAVAVGASEPSAGTAPLGDGELVLLVDDDARVLEATHRLLEGLGYAVVSVGSGAEAIALIGRGEPVQVVVSDIVMPSGLSGFDVARHIRAKHPGIEVLLASGYFDAESNAAPQGIEILRKPYSRDAIGRALWTALHREAETSSGHSTRPANT